MNIEIKRLTAIIYLLLSLIAFALIFFFTARNIQLTQENEELKIQIEKSINLTNECLEAAKKCTGTLEYCIDELDKYSSPYPYPLRGESQENEQNSRSI